MIELSADDRELIGRLRAGDTRALAEAFDGFRKPLGRMIRLRLDRRLQGRIDPEDVLQETFLDAHIRAAAYAADPNMPVFLWLRFLAAQRLLILHRYHLGTKRRDAGLEVSLARPDLPAASSRSLAEQLLGRLTSPSRAAIRAEMQRRLQVALNSMDAIDREVVALYHFEELRFDEVAACLGLSKSGASSRYYRAITRLKEILKSLPGFVDP